MTGFYAVATGTRADWGLMRPLLRELSRRGVSLRVYTTNMHADPKFGNSAAEICADGFVPVPVGQYRQLPEEIVAENVEAFGRCFRADPPKGVLVLGDRMEMLGVASAALLSGVPVIHIAGGTVSEGAVDNTIRDMISRVASLHLTETPATACRLRKMGISPDRIFVCGALGVYNALNRQLIGREELERQLSFSLGCQLLIGTLHAATLPGAGEEPLAAMASFLDALGRWLALSEGNRLILTWPNNDVDPAPQIAAMDDFAARYPGQVKVVPSLGALRYLSAVALSKGVVGNSSSGLVEVPSAGVPTLDIGSRQKGRECGPSVWHCAPDSESVFNGILHILTPQFQALAARKENPYARPDTPALMADAILSYDV